MSVSHGGVFPGVFVLVFLINKEVIFTIYEPHQSQGINRSLFIFNPQDLGLKTLKLQMFIAPQFAVEPCRFI